MTPSSPESSGSAGLAATAVGSEGKTNAEPSGSFFFGKLLKWLAVLLLLVAGAGCLLAELDIQFQSAKNTSDFLALYTAGTILRHGGRKQLYDIALQTGIQKGLQPHHLRMPFYHPPFEAWLFEGIARLPLVQAYLLWAVVNLLLLGAIFYLLRFTGYRLDQDRRLVWLVALLPAVAGVVVKGQDTLLLGLVFLLAFLALKKRRDATAGLVLGAGLFRFEIVLPFVFIFFLRKRWNLLAGFSAAAAALGLVSLLTVGWRGLLEYGTILLQVGRARGGTIEGEVAAMPTLRGIIATLFGVLIPAGFLFPLILAATLLLLGWAAWEFRSVAAPETRAFDLQFSLAVIAAVLASYHLFLYALTPLIIAAFLLLAYENWAQDQGAGVGRTGTILLLLLGVLPILGAVVHFDHFSVLFFVLLGLAVWSAQEIAALGRQSV